MATVLVVEFEVSDDVDPTLEDPEEIAGDLLAGWELDRRANGGPRYLTGIVEASWTTV